MKLSKKDLAMLLAVLGIGAVLAVYLLYFKPTQEDTQRLKADNQRLEARIKELEALRDQKEFFESEIARYTEAVDEIYAQFPAGLYPEDVITQGIEMEDASLVAVSTFQIEEPVSIYKPIGTKLSDFENVTTKSSAGSADTAKAEAAEDDIESAEATPAKKEVVETGFDTMQEAVTYAFTGDLSQFEKAVENVNARDNRDVVDTVSLSYDSSTGLLAGQMKIYKYYVTGRDDVEYVPSTFTVPTGTSNLFSTFVKGASSAGGEATE